MDEALNRKKEEKLRRELDDLEQEARLLREREDIKKREQEERDRLEKKENDGKERERIYLEGQQKQKEALEDEKAKSKKRFTTRKQTDNDFQKNSEILIETKRDEQPASMPSNYNPYNSQALDASQL